MRNRNHDTGKPTIPTSDATAPSCVKHLRSHIAACRQSSLCASEPLTLGIETNFSNAWTRISAQRVNQTNGPSPIQILLHLTVDAVGYISIVTESAYVG